VRHHISASAGRKLRDEENTFKLVQRWRDRLAALGTEAWCRHYLQVNWTNSRDPSEHARGRAILFNDYGFDARPPKLAQEGMQRAIEAEIRRWRELFTKE
jgi:hypothetical protein